MTIAEARASCKAALVRIPSGLALVGALLLVALASYGLGILTAGERPSTGSGQGAAIEAAAPAAAASGYVASQNGTKYYPPGCSGASRISASNLITFDSAEAAEAAGYTLAANCK